MVVGSMLATRTTNSDSFGWLRVTVLVVCSMLSTRIRTAKDLVNFCVKASAES